MKPILLPLFLALALACAAVHAQELKRLFLTPEQRAMLDARRKARVPDKPLPPPVVVAPTTRLDGYVRRSDGRATVWVNGIPLDESASPRPRIAPDARVSVTVGDSGARVQLKPGQALDRSSGEVTDLLGPGGEIRVREAR